MRQSKSKRKMADVIRASSRPFIFRARIGRKTESVVPAPRVRGSWLTIAMLAIVTVADVSLMAESTHADHPRPRMILDADTANEIDDLFAIMRMLQQDQFDLLGITSAQWFHYLGERQSVEASQADNEELCRAMGRTDLPLPMGSSEPMGRPWGGEEPKNSAAAQFIIEQAKQTPEGEQLVVVCIGASTNLASAIKLAPEILPKLKAYVLGFQYDVAEGIWNKSEFNIRRDLNAADFLLNHRGLELHVMPTSVSGQLKFERDATFRELHPLGDAGALLTEKWKTKFGESKTWTMWDVALVEAILVPELASEKQVTTPPENVQRRVWMYDSIDATRMKIDFWNQVKR